MKWLSSFVTLTVVFVLSFAVLSTFLQTPNVTSPVVLGTSAPTPAPLDEKVLFVSDQKGNKDIYLIDGVTKEVTQLTNDPSDEMNPQVSPDHRFITYYSNKDGDNEIYEMELASRKSIQLTSNTIEDYDPSYTPDGKSILFKSERDDSKGDIFLMNRDGTKPRNLTPNTTETEEWDPVMSNTGTIFYVVRTNDSFLTDELYLMTSNADDAQQLTENTYPDWYPAVSETGEVVFISKETAKAEDDIYLLNMQTLTRTRLTTGKGNDADPAWSRDGKTIVYINDRDGDYDLYLMNADGTQKQLLLNTPFTELSPVFL